MTSVKTKKRFIYLVYSCLFLFGGIEYSVILPTLWLYLSNTYDAPEYMLGLVLSSYSLACLFSAPLLGRLADRFRRTKGILIFCASIQVVGSFLYFVGISQWLCLSSRFICGIGGAAESVALAEVSRYAAEGELTGIMSKLVAMRQIALVAAPGLNLILRLLEFKIGPFDLNKYTAPGALMTVVWLVLIVIIVCFYCEPQHVHNEEKREKRKQAMVERIQSIARETTDTTPDYTDHVDGSSGKADVVEVDGVDTSHHIPAAIIQDYNDSVATHKLRAEDFGSSYDVMATAERVICSAEFHGHSDTELDPSGGEGMESGESWSVINADEATCLLPPVDGAVGGGGGVGPRATDSNEAQNASNEDYLEYYLSHMEDPIAREGKMGFFCKEYVRDEVMAIIMLLFCAMFSQVALETMCTPLSQVYMDFGELENSVLYSLCGVEIIIAFVVVSVVSKRVSDRIMILFGGFLLLAANVWLLIFLPSAPKHNVSYNLPYVGTAVAMDVWSLPFLLVCATSLYSKMTRKETQGVSQGLRRGVVGLGTILGPLWASSIVPRPHLVLGVLIGIQSLFLLMCILSFPRLKALDTRAQGRLSIASNGNKPCRSHGRHSHSSLLDAVPVRDDYEDAERRRSSQYGSILSVSPPTC